MVLNMKRKDYHDDYWDRLLDQMEYHYEEIKNRKTRKALRVWNSLIKS